VAAAAKTAGETLEAAGRRLRYGFLESAARAAGAPVVAVGHQADDQAETVFHHIVRGTGLRGLAGMSPGRPIRQGSEIELVRPLLTFRRAELRAYLAHRSLPYLDDPTNANEEAATRNRIRHEILPLLGRTVNPEITTALLRLSTHARRAEEAIAAVAADALGRARIRRSDSEVVLSAEVVAALPQSIRTQVVLLVLRDLQVGLQAIGHERIEAAAAVASGDGRRRLIELAGGVTVERRGRELRIRAGVGGGSDALSRATPVGDECR
jgi:tRNA(Ile)-lysidine synthase